MIDFPSDPRGRELWLLIERTKYERWLAGQVDALLEREFNRLVDLILSGKYRSLTRFERQRMLQLFRALEERISVAYKDLTTLVAHELPGVAQLEADVARGQAVSTLGLDAATTLGIDLGVSLPKRYLESIAKLPIQGLRLGDWFDVQAATMSREVRRIIQQGLIEGRGTADIARRIVADDRAAGPVLARRAKNDARIIARTAVNAVQNDAAIESYEDLPESVSDSYRLVAVRDDRTSLTCIALDGRVFRYDDPRRKLPPFHLNCRTSVVPIVRGAETPIGTQKEAPLTMRSFADWLTGQPIGTQNDLLGATRAGLWRDGTMTLADAIDRDNRVLSLKQLRARLNLDALAAR